MLKVLTKDLLRAWSDRNRIGFLLKTYNRDFALVAKLLESFALYNRERIPLFVIVSKIEFTAGFNDILKSYEAGSDIFVVFEEFFKEWLVDETMHGLSIGYLNQEIIKLCFSELRLVDNYFCLDSDSVFIRDFFVKDFIASDGYPFTVLVDDGPIYSGVYYDLHMPYREHFLNKIRMCLGIDYKLMTCHGFQIINVGVMHEFIHTFMKKEQISYVDLMRIAPLEFSWYTYFLQHKGSIPIHATKELVKTFHSPEQYVWSCILNSDLDVLRDRYIGYVINSNYTNGRVVEYGDIEHLKVRLKHNKVYFVKECIRFKLGSLFRMCYKRWQWFSKSR